MSSSLGKTFIFPSYVFKIFTLFKKPHCLWLSEKRKSQGSMHTKPYTSVSTVATSERVEVVFGKKGALPYIFYTPI